MSVALSVLDRCPALALIGNTPLVRVDAFRDELPGREILAKCEWMNPGGSVKDRPVLRMLLDAIERGALSPGKTILDSSSGNAGIAYAMIGGALGFPVEVVVPANASSERRLRIRAHGAKLRLTDAPLGYDEALREAHRLAAADPGKYFFSDQYSNDSNWRAHYETTAVEILEQVGGPITHFVAGIGTGGTITGIGRRLKERDPSIRVVCVVPEEFPGIEGLKPLATPEAIRPSILDESVIDERVAVTSEEAYEHCQLLASRGLFVGQSSGAYLKAARDVASREPGARIVTVFSDTGERYYSARLWDAP